MKDPLKIEDTIKTSFTECSLIACSLSLGFDLVDAMGYVVLPIIAAVFVQQILTQWAAYSPAPPLPPLTIQFANGNILICCREDCQIYS